MDNQHRLIKGYRELSQVEIDLMNEIKERAESLHVLTMKIKQHLHETCIYETVQKMIEDKGMSEPINGVSYQQGSWTCGPTEETRRWQNAQPYLWVDRAVSDLQDGFMKLTRAVAQPTTF